MSKLGFVTVLVSVVVGVSAVASQSVVVDFNGVDMSEVVDLKKGDDKAKDRADAIVNKIKETSKDDSCVQQAFQMAKILHKSSNYLGNIELRAMAIDARLNPKADKSKKLKTYVIIESRGKNIMMTLASQRKGEDLQVAAGAESNAMMQKNSNGTESLNCKAMELSDELFKEANQKLIDLM